MKSLLPSIELIVEDPKWEGYSLWKYLKLNIPHYTKLLVIKELRLKHILVNQEASFFQYKLKAGDRISVLVLPDNSSGRKEKKIPSCSSISLREQLLFENENMVIVSKQAGQLVQPDLSLSSDSLEAALQLYLGNFSKGDYKAKFVHRLDRPVSGLLIGAKNAKAHIQLGKSLREREITKIYEAIVLGKCTFRKRELRHWILDKGRRVQIQDEEDPFSKLSLSKVTTLESGENFSYLEIELITGRKNQIRAQLAHIGFPILGDRKYYSEEVKKVLRNIRQKNIPLFFNTRKIALVSTKLVFPDYLCRELKLPKGVFVLPEEKNILKPFLGRQRPI